MIKVINLNRGLRLNLEGAARDEVGKIRNDTGDVVICPDDFTGFVPRIAVKEGDSVEIGTPLLVDKRNEAQCVTATVSGKIKSVERGERRKLLAVKIENDGTYKSLDFGKNDLTQLTAQTVIDILNKTGLSAYMRQRPYDIVPDTRIMPRDIFVSAFNSMPLAADFNIVVRGRENFFIAGIRALGLIAPVHLGVSSEQENTFLTKIENTDINIFKGYNPAGNVGVQINNTYPVNKGEIVWTVRAEDVIPLGKLLQTGILDFTRRIALAGAEVVTPQYYDIVIGTCLRTLLDGKIKHKEHIRIINGNPMVGKKATIDGFLAADSTEVTVIPEGDDVNEFLGWIRPRTDLFSMSHSYLSWLFPNKKYNIDARIKGGERHIIMSGEYDKVLPMNIYAGYLIKAIITKDVERMEALGIYEVAPEDFAVCEFVDSSKLELQRIVREGLDFLRKEME